MLSDSLYSNWGIAFIIPPAYEVGGVYSFCFFCLYVHLCVCKLFSSKTVPRILKLGTDVGCDLLYCVKENQSPAAYHSICPFFFASKTLWQVSQLL